MSKNFIKYNSIENSYQKKTMLCFSEAVGNRKIKWAITEKIHGANFQIFCDGENILCGKRNSFLNKNDSFCNYQLASDKFLDKIKNLQHFCEDKITVYGELFGGNFEGYKSQYKAIQKGVQYTPNIELLFYDLMIGGKYVPYQQAMDLFDKFDIPYIKPMIVESTFEEVLNFDTKFNSTIPPYFGLPILENNICEGVVVKPLTEEIYSHDGRVIVKIKNEEFLEKSKEPKPKVEINSEVMTIVALIEDYINENRFWSVLSKDNYQKKDFSKFMSDFYLDVVDDAIKDGIDINNLDKEVLRIIKRSIGYKICSLVKPLFFSEVE